MYPHLIKTCLLSFFTGVFVFSLFGIDKIYYLFIPLGFTLALLWNYKKFLNYLLIIVFFLAGMGRVFIANEVINENHIAFYANENRKVEIIGYVKREPEIKNGSLYVILEGEKVIYDKLHAKVKGLVQIKTNKYGGYEYGEKLRINGYLLRPKKFKDFDYPKFLEKDSVYAVMYSPKIMSINKKHRFTLWNGIFSLKRIIQNNIEALFGEPESGIILGLLIGYRASIPESMLVDFQRTGLTHILAISGYNITLLINVLNALICFIGRRWRLFFILLAIVFFAVITGLSASVVRASIMGGMTVIALNLGRKGEALQTLLFSAFFMILHNPKILVWDISFQLSFVSTLGLLLLLPIFEKLFSRWPKWIRENLLVTISATIFTMPIVLFNFGAISIISPLANVMFLPLIPLIMLASFFSLVAYVLYLPLYIIFMAVSWLLLFFLIDGVKLFAKFPYTYIENINFNWIHFIFFYFAVGIFIYVFRKSKLDHVSVFRF
ncbi:DUF4131 domain-containing protein [Candidatus Peregrinibacteria bacterium]|nr:DUF4131 domain-containing protein [Candidatus Peregrinibacteria bacterium]